MLQLRGLLFTMLVPGLVAVYMPHLIIGSRLQQGGLWQTGCLLIALGSAIYSNCLLSFLAANGTPAIFFTYHLRMVIGNEPSALVRGGLYKFSRNPMYLGVVLVTIGQAILYASGPLAAYGITMFLFFHLVVVFIEEPHLKARDPKSFEQYCCEVPRWFGLEKKSRAKA
ncbi:MAG: hypothetical protein JOY85_25980 [Acidobacteriaceae bacterium]|nr:hypothetical protein [Acidobacteriaceae bacterium]